ncbi:hypothetical protein [Desulfosediminicola ganghwensis]|uniref:hypothetical protein n=1 Tax=Desulfosediminicola ganghwensis TaxID=2569540 RepID=UPI0010ACCEF8|nr:hypothetical protein [Desulfosediminicola ganghwensis]
MEVDYADQMPILATLGNYANHCRFTGIVIMVTATTGDNDIKTCKNNYFAGDETDFGVSWVWWRMQG